MNYHRPSPGLKSLSAFIILQAVRDLKARSSKDRESASKFLKGDDALLIASLLTIRQSTYREFLSEQVTK